MQHTFVADILTNPNNAQILARWHHLSLPDSWLVAGCLFQTVWNRLSAKSPEADIKDYDIFYFDATDVSAEAEQARQEEANALFHDLNITVEVCNQARVHLWYESHFGYPYTQLHNSRQGIDRFLIPSTCVGINPDAVYAPHGFEPLYQGILSINPLTPHRDLYESKAESYQQRWPWLSRLES
jgi:uncharacterized protein